MSYRSTMAMIAVLGAATGCSEQQGGRKASAPQQANSMLQDVPGGLTVLRFGVFQPADPALAEIDGQPFASDATYGLVEVQLPSAEALPKTVDLSALPDGWTVRWRREETPSDPNDPLCANSARHNHEGDVMCGERWTTETIDAAHPAAGKVEFRSASLDGISPIDMTLEVNAFKKSGAAPTPDIYCCGRARIDVDARPDDKGDFLVSFQNWMTGTACQFDHLESAAGANPCPAEF